MSTHHTGVGRDGLSLRKDGLPVVLLLALGTAFLFELLTMSGVPFARDIQLFFLPHKRILWEAFQDGSVPLWTSLINTGYPVLANFQSGVFYPPHWLFAVTPFLIGFNWLIVLHLFLGGVATYVLCREIRFDRPASWVAAVSFMLGGYFVSLTNLINVLQTAAWTPLMVLAMIRQIREPGPARFGLVTVVYLFAFLAGAPYTFLLAAGMSTVFVLVWATEHLREEQAWKTGLVTISIAAVVVAGIASVQILPTLQMVAESVRAGGISFEEAGDFSIDPPQLLHLFFPNDFSDPTYNYGQKLQVTTAVPWLYSLYLGIAPLILSLFSWREQNRRKEVAFWIGTAILGILLGLGRYLPLFRILYEFVPGFDSFRYPEKFFLLTGFSVPILAAHGMSALRRRGSGGRWAMIVAGSAAGLAVAANAFWRLFGKEARLLISRGFPEANVSKHVDFAYETWLGGLDEMAFLLVAVVVVIALYRRKVLRTSVFAALVIVLVGTDFWLAHRHLIPLVDPDFYRQDPGVTNVLPEKELHENYRYWATPFDESTGTYYTFPNLSVSTAKWMWQQTVQPNTGSLHGILTLDSGDAMHLEIADARRRLLRELKDSWRWRLLEMSSVSWLYSPEDYESERYADRIPLDSIPGYVYNLRAPLPRAYIGKGVFHSNERAVLRSSIDPSRRGHRPVALLGDSLGRPPKKLVSWAREKSGFDLAVADRIGPSGALRSESDSASVDTVTQSTKDDQAPLSRKPSGGHRAYPEEDFGKAEIVTDVGEEVQIRVDPSEAGFLVLTDTPYPGWRVRVDGERRPLLRGNWFFRAVPVAPGDKEVVFRYRSAPYRLGRIVSGASVLVVLSGLLGWKWRRAREADLKGT